MTRMDRRALFTSGAAAALLAATGVTAGAAPRPGGHLRLAVPRDGSLQAVVQGAVFDQLTDISADGILRGNLATHWEATDGARRWTFQLARTARFHDGTPFTASLATAALSALDIPGLRAIRAEGAQRLVLELRTANPDLPLILANPQYSVASPAADPANGTGAYRIIRYDPDRHALVRKAGGHHRDGHAGWLEAFEAIVIPDAGVRAEALRDGFVDVAYLPAPDGLPGDFRFHPTRENMVIAAQPRVGLPARIGTRAPLDDGLIAERWWMA